MLNKYNDFILDKQFDSIINGFFHIIESKDDDPIIFEWDISNKNKLKKFLSRQTKNQIKKYFYRFLEKIKNAPKSVRKKMLISYSIIFLSLVPFDYLIEDQLDITEEQKELIQEFEEELIEIKEKKIRKSDFNKSQKIVKRAEAGYSNDRKDKGNFIKTPYGKRFIGTNHGISAPILADYLNRLPTKEEMENLSYETALDIYKRKFWNPQNLSEFIDQNIADIIYDGCVNQGISGTKKVLREVYNKNNIKISDNDNPFNISFINQLNKLDQEKIFNDIKLQRENRYKLSPTYKIHGKGWLSRLSKFEYNVEKNS